MRNERGERRGARQGVAASLILNCGIEQRLAGAGQQVAVGVGVAERRGALGGERIVSAAVGGGLLELDTGHAGGGQKLLYGGLQLDGIVHLDGDFPGGQGQERAILRHGDFAAERGSQIVAQIHADQGLYIGKVLRKSRVGLLHGHDLVNDGGGLLHGGGPCQGGLRRNEVQRSERGGRGQPGCNARARPVEDDRGARFGGAGVAGLLHHEILHV